MVTDKDLLVVGESPHGLQQQLGDGAQQADGHARRQVLLGQVEDAGAGRQLDMQRHRVVLHSHHHQLWSRRISISYGLI